MLRSVVCTAVLIAAAMPLISCTSPQAKGEQSVGPEYVESTARFRKLYLLAAGDQVNVSVRGNLEVSQPCLIRPDGYLTLPRLGDVRAAGLTVPALATDLTTRFSERLVDPEVTVVATKVREPSVFVVGEVAAPQPVPFAQAATAAQAVTAAGGLKHSARTDSIALIRVTEDGRLVAYKIPLEAEGQPAPYLALQATPLQPDDLLFVPERNIVGFARWVNEYVITPLSGVNSVLSPIANYLLIERLLEEDF